MQSSYTCIGLARDSRAAIRLDRFFDEALKITDRVYLTRVKAHVDGDKYFNFSTEGWRRASSEKHQADERNQYDFEFQEWVRQ